VADDRTLPFTERAYQNYQDEMKDLKDVEALLQKKDRDEVEEYREPLSMEERREVTILLSWGGPSDGYKVYFDPDGEVVEGYYTSLQTGLSTKKSSSAMRSLTGYYPYIFNTTGCW